MSLLLLHTSTRELGSPEEDAVFAGALLALAASATFLCHALVCRGLAAQFWKVLVSSARRGETPMQGLIAERLRAESQSNALGLNLFVTSWLCMNNAVMLYNIAIGASRWMTFWQDALWIWATFVCVICQLALRRSARRSTVPAVYVCFSVMQTAFVALGPGKPVPYIATAGFSVIFRLLWSLACMRLPLVACTTTLHFVSACVGFMHTEAPCDDGAGFQMSVFLGWEMIGDIAILTCTVVWRHFCSLRILHEIQGSISQSGNQAARSLLNIVCDATVELDKELNITDQAPRFASLLQHGYDRSLKGSQMLQFIVPEDKLLFTDRVSAPIEDSDHSMANVFHMRVRDSINNVLSVEVFHVPVTNYFAGDSHLIGVREYTDAADNVGVLPKMGRKKGRAQGTRSRTARVTPLPSDEPPGSAPSADADANESGGSGSPSSPRSSWSSPSSGQGEDNSSEIAAWIDVLSDGWDIKSCTAAFQLFSEAAPRVHGAASGKGELLRWIKPDHKDSLIHWVQDTYQEMRSLRIAEPVPSPAPRFFGQLVHFRPPALRRVRVRVAYAARVALALPEECLLQNTLAKLVFFDVRLLQQEDLQNAVSA